MKFTGLLFFLTIGLSSFLNAQQFNGTLIGGISTTQISGDQLAGFNKAGIVMGAGVSTSIGKDWEIEMQISYMQKGSRKNAQPDKNDFVYYLLRLNYIEVPLLFNYTQADKMRFEMGPALGVLLSSFEENQDGEYIGRTPFEDYDVSFNIGMMYSFVENLYINTRYSTSVLKVREHSSGSTDRLNKGQYNSVLMFGLKYYLLKNNNN